MRLTTTWSSAAVVACAALLLAGCGGDGGDGGKSDEIVGADGGDKAKESEKPASAPKTPKFDLPSDVKVIVDDNKTGDEKKDEVLRDHGYAMMAMQEAFAATKATENFTRYWDGEAAASYEANFKEYAKDGATITGTDRFYGRAVMSIKGKEALVTYCEDQSKAFDKDASSGKVYKTEPSIDSFIEARTEMQKNSAGDWQVVDATAVEGSKSCKEDA